MARHNAPLKGARSIGSNMTEVEHGDLTILYSYETPVAFLSPSGGYVTEKHWSNTTSRHIGKFFDRHGYDRRGAHKLPQEDIELFVTAGKVGPQSSVREDIENPRERRHELAVLALSATGDPEDWDYVIAAAPVGPNVWSWSYWYVPDPQEGDTYVILRAGVDADDDAADLIAHGTREQYFSDGYEAAGAIDEAKVVDSWTVEEED